MDNFLDNMLENLEKHLPDVEDEETLKQGIQSYAQLTIGRSLRDIASAIREHTLALAGDQLETVATTDEPEQDDTL